MPDRDSSVDRQVAEALGWRRVQAPKWDYDGKVPEQGEVLVPTGFDEKTYVWPPRGVVPFEFFLNAGPKWSTDISDACGLITPADTFGLERSIINGVWRWTASFSRGGVGAARIADTAPLAISEAFLAFTEALASRTKEQP